MFAAHVKAASGIRFTRVVSCKGAHLPGWISLTGESCSVMMPHLVWIMIYVQQTAGIRPATPKFIDTVHMIPANTAHMADKLHSELSNGCF